MGEISELRARIENLIRQRERKTGELDAARKRLKEMGCSNPKEVKEKLAQLEAAAEAAEEGYEKALTHLEERVGAIERRVRG